MKQTINCNCAKVWCSRGSIMPLTAVCIVAICGFVAFAVDIGTVANARTQAQHAADAAASAAARTLDSGSLENRNQATANAINAATKNLVLGEFVKDAEVSVRHGAYHYDQHSERFTPQFPAEPPDTYNLSEVTITLSRKTFFAQIIGVNSFNVSATATAAHRPRDIAIILDLSGSMNDESDLWNTVSYLGDVDYTSNSTESVFPQFGHYSSIASAALQNTSGDPRVGKSNVSHEALGTPPLVSDFFQHSRGSSPTVPAFTAAPDAYATTPGGDNYLVKHSTTTPAKTVLEITNNASTPFLGYGPIPFVGYTGPVVLPFAGYTQGPRYWGKTFFIWPPDPDPAKDWRRQLFLKTGGSYPNFGGPLDDNTKLWDSSGNFRTPSGNYVINYKAILSWIKSTGPNPFPSLLRAGRILYYDSIPTDVPAAAYDHNNPNRNISDPNQRFWKEYIDFALGVWRCPYGNVQVPGLYPGCSYGPDYAWGTVKISSPQSGLSNGPPDGVGPLANWNRIDPQDNPKRPRHRMWFGPMTMVQYLLDAGLMPGTVHDISMYSCKIGIAAALEDIRNNHPNDLVSLIFFNRPRFNGEPIEAGRFSRAQVDLGHDYSGMQQAMWFPPNSTTTDIRPWDTDGLQTPRSHSDYIWNTCYNYGFMLAYNQFTAERSLQSQAMGGWGRRGAQRLIIFETDGMANAAASAGFTSNGNKSYYKIGPTDTVTPSGDPETAVYQVVDRIVAMENDTVKGPGFARRGLPVVIHCLAFGSIFEPTASGTERAEAIALLQNISQKGGTVFPDSHADPVNGYKFCIGALEERQAKLREAFRRVTDAGTSIMLVD